MHKRCFWHHKSLASFSKHYSDLISLLFCGERLRPLEGTCSQRSLFLHRQQSFLNEASGVSSLLGRAGGAKRFFESEGYDPRTSNVLRMLGYFSLVGLGRVHALIGDFYTSLQAVHPINPFLKKHLYTSKVTGKQRCSIHSSARDRETCMWWMASPIMLRGSMQPFLCSVSIQSEGILIL